MPIQFKLGPLTTISIGVGLLARGGRGTSYRKSNLPKEPIEIWGYEASPFVKLAREVGLYAEKWQLARTFSHQSVLLKTPGWQGPGPSALPYNPIDQLAS